MRVIEPEQLKRRSIKKKKRSPIPLLIFVAVVAVLGIAIWYKIKPQKVAFVLHQNTNSKEVKGASIVADQPKKGTLRQFTNQEFVQFYSSFAYPNTVEITSPPAITGNPAADKRIQAIAEARGYKLRSVPISPPIALQDGFFIQQKAQQPFLDMQAAAKKAGSSLVLTAGFRSIDDQKALFLPQLQDLHATPEAIATGNADAAVDAVMNIVAPPGYSRHHNGFTIDMACGNIGGMAFLGTDCYKWLSTNNFAHAKEFGWIPSYPQGTASVGPEPEPWEYVWVGKDALTE